MNARASDPGAGLAVLVDLWLGSYGSENTRSAYAADVAAFSSWCGERGRLALDATTADVARYLAWSGRSGAGGATVARRRSALTSFFAFAHENDAGLDNPMTALSRSAPSSPRSTSTTAVLADNDARALLRASDRIGPKTGALVRLLMSDGVRLGEVLAADVRDFQHEPGEAGLIVHRRGRRQVIPLTLPTARKVREYLERRRRGPLFLCDTPGRDGARLSRFGADYLLKEAARVAGLDARISANALRRRYVATAAARGMHIDDIRDHVGHRDVRTTRRYLDPDDSATPSSPKGAQPERR
jgi:site-specific recombinase XerD